MAARHSNKEWGATPDEPGQAAWRLFRPSPVGARLAGLKGRWVFPVSGEPIRDGVVWTENGRILEVGPAGTGGVPLPARDLGNVAILPGLVNAHTHLELSGFDCPLGYQGIPFVDWIRAVVAARRSGDHDPDESVRRGLAECAAAGVAEVGEIAQPGFSSEPFAGCRTDSRGRPRVTVFLEMIGPTAERAAEAVRRAETHVGASGGEWRPGISPHAPHSVRPELLEEACRISREQCVPLAMHLAESREEVQLLRESTGPMRRFLEEIGAWDGSIHPAGRRARDYLEILASADRALVIHGNYLNGDEIAFLAERSGTMAVVYCPRTHAWFAHDAYPLEAMLDSGVTVALGTDSRASSPDLDLLEDLRFAARRHPHVEPARILEMATLAGARALGLENEAGTLEPGKRADLAVVPLPDALGGDPYRLLIGEARRADFRSGGSRASGR